MAHSFKAIFKKIFLFIISFLVAFFLRLIFFTCKKEFKGNLIDDRGSVVVFWHGRLAMMSFAYYKFWHRQNGKNKQAKVIISDHKDGEFITRIIQRFGIGAIRGSSSKGGVRALSLAIKELKSGVDIIITPDGPRGPRHSVASGAAALAIKTGAPFYVLNYESDNYWEFKSWDGMILPKPFSKLTFNLTPVNLSTNQYCARREIMQHLWNLSYLDGGMSLENSQKEYCIRLNLWANGLRKRKKPLLLDDEMINISYEISKKVGIDIDLSDPYGKSKKIQEDLQLQDKSKIKDFHNV